MIFRSLRLAALGFLLSVLPVSILQVSLAWGQQGSDLPRAKDCFSSTEPALALQNAEFNLQLLQMPITSVSTISWEYKPKYDAYDSYYHCMNRYFDAEPEKARLKLQDDLTKLADYFSTKEQVSEVRLYMLANILSDIADGEASRGNVAARLEAVKRLKIIVADGEALIKKYAAEKGAKHFAESFLSELKRIVASQLSAAGQTEEAVTVLREALALDERNTRAASLLANLTSPRNDSVVTSPLKVNNDKMVRMQSLSFNGDGTLLLVIAADGSYREWNWRAGTIKQQGLIPQLMKGYWSIGYLPQGEGLYAIGSQFKDDSLNKDPLIGEVFESWVPGTSKLILSLASDRRPIQFAGEAGFIVFNTQGKTVLLDPSDGSEIREIEAIYTGSFELFGQKETRKNLRSAEYQPRFVVSDDGSKFSAYHFPADSFVSVGEVATGKVRHILIADSVNTGHQVFSSDGQFLAAADITTLTVHLFNYKTGKLVASLKGHAQPADMVFSPDGTLLATWSEDNRLIFWNTKNGETVRQLPLEGRPTDGKFSPDGTKFATSHGDGSTKVWDMVSGKLLVTLYALDPEGMHSDKSLALLPDGRFATNAPDASVLLLMDGKPIPAHELAKASLGGSVPSELIEP